jgi:hypothetical protein
MRPAGIHKYWPGLKRLAVNRLAGIALTADSRKKPVTPDLIP